MSGTDARAAAIAALGYAPREAAFLACVTRHGGYFLRRADPRRRDRQTFAQRFQPRKGQSLVLRTANQHIRGGH